MSRPTLSIITPSFNQAQFIERTICSVLDQAGDFRLEYRVVDGGSSDGTLDILRKYEAHLTWTSEKDRGQVHAINKGLHAAKGEIIGWVNSDDVLRPSALARVVSAFDRTPSAEWLHGRCEIIDENDVPVRRWVSHYKHLRARRHSFDNLITENYVSQMTTFWRRRVHEDIGYLDETLKLAFDYDLWLRLAARGAPLYLEDTLACFRWYESSKSGSSFEAQFAEDAQVAARYLQGKPLVRLRKHAKTLGIVRAYRAMSLLRSAQAALRGTSTPASPLASQTERRTLGTHEKYNDTALHFDACDLPPLLLGHLPQGPLAFADVGCGDGPLFAELQRRGSIDASQPVYAVDLEQQRLDRVGRRFPFVHRIVAAADDVEAIPSASLDFLNSSMVMEHVPNEAKYLDEIARVLRPGGRAYITTVYKKPWAWYFRKREGESVLDRSHLREYTDLDAFRRTLLGNGRFRMLRALELEPLWFPLADPILFRLAAARRLSPQAIRALRTIRVPIPGYYSLNTVIER